MTRKLIDIDNLNGFEIPRDIAVCPCCGSGLYITEIPECEIDEDGSLIPVHLHLECLGEPDEDDEAWDEWDASHSRMPYVYWLPVELRVLEWLRKSFDFVSSREEQEKLERWI